MCHERPLETCVIEGVKLDENNADDLPEKVLCIPRSYTGITVVILMASSQRRPMTDQIRSAC